MSIIQMTPAEFRAKYLKNLTTEVKNQQKYLEATKVFNQTGEVLTPPDLRTLDEKSLDMEGLKNLIIKELESLTDRGNASSFVNNITNINSPDLSTKQLKNFYQFFPNFEAEVKKRFRYGVSSTILLDFYRKYAANFNEENYGIETPLTAVSIAEAIDKKMRGETDEKRYERNFEDFVKESELQPTTAESSVLPSFKILGQAKNINDIPYKLDNERYTANGGKDRLLEDYTDLIEELQNQINNKEALNLSQIQENDRNVFINDYLTKKPKNSTGKLYGTFVKKILLQNNDKNWVDLINLAKGEDIQQNIAGKGIKKNMRVKNISQEKKIIKGKGIIKSKKGNKLAEFGKYYIDPNLLEENIISMKNNPEIRRSLPTIPTKRVSEKVSNVVKKIVGGAISLSYEDVIDLDDNEKMYLNDLVKKVKLNDVIKVPVPNKEKQKQEIDRFELLKGQILSGNDSKELIKEFKVLLLKFQKEGKLPKREVNEILYELMILS